VRGVRELRGRVVAPDDCLADVGRVDPRAHRELCVEAVVVEAREGCDVLAGDCGRGVLREDGSVGVGRVADDDNLAVRVAHLLENVALRGKDLAVLAEEVLALHARLARESAEHDDVVAVLEGHGGVRGDHRLAERLGAEVLELEHDTLHGLNSRLNVEEVEVHLDIGAEDGAIEEAREERVGDLTGGAGHRNSDGGLHHGRNDGRMGA